MENILIFADLDAVSCSYPNQIEGMITKVNPKVLVSAICSSPARMGEKFVKT